MVSISPYPGSLDASAASRQAGGVLLHRGSSSQHTEQRNHNDGMFQRSSMVEVAKPPSRPGSPQGKTLKAGAQARQSYRGLLDTLDATERAIALYADEEKTHRSESRSLRSSLLRTQALTEEIAACECQHTWDLYALQTEADELWKAHEEPLRKQEDALRSSLSLATALEESAGAQDDGLGSLRLECQSLGRLGNTLESEVAQGQQGHQSVAEQLSKGHRELEALEKSLDQSEARAQELQGLARARSCHRKSLADETTAEQLQIQALRQELQDMERQHRFRITGWVRDTAVSSDSLGIKYKSWEAELEQGRQLLETHTRETSLWREQAYRQESALAALHGTDVANGIRSLAEECMTQCKAAGSSSRT